MCDALSKADESICSDQWFFSLSRLVKTENFLLSIREKTLRWRTNGKLNHAKMNEWLSCCVNCDDLCNDRTSPLSCDVRQFICIHDVMWLPLFTVQRMKSFICGFLFYSTEVRIRWWLKWVTWNCSRTFLYYTIWWNYFIMLWNCGNYECHESKINASGTYEFFIGFFKEFSRWRVKKLQV